MKKVIAIACLLVVLTLAVSAIASAQQPNWRFFLKADDNNNSNAMAAMTIGVQSGSKDGFGVDGTGSDTQDGKASIPSTANTRGVVALQNSMAWVKDVKSPRLPLDPAYNAGMVGPNGSTFGTYPYESNRKIWDLRVFCLPTNSLNPNDVIRLSFTTVASTVLPPATLAPFVGSTAEGAKNKFFLRMVNNMGVEGAPANGTVWNIPIPTAHSTTAWFTLTLPAKYVSAASEGAVLTEGYQMQFFQTPEPSSLLALGTGLMGLAGFASRRRRS